MIPFRLLILAILCYIGWRFLRRFVLSKPAETVLDDTSQGPDPELQDVLVEDPVCHTLIPRNQAIRLRKNDTTYYFCSEACCDQFSEHYEKGAQ
jgi:YHS domain-containing protein